MKRFVFDGSVCVIGVLGLTPIDTIVGQQSSNLLSGSFRSAEIFIPSSAQTFPQFPLGRCCLRYVPIFLSEEITPVNSSNATHAFRRLR